MSDTDHKPGMEAENARLREHDYLFGIAKRLGDVKALEVAAEEMARMRTGADRIRDLEAALREIVAECSDVHGHCFQFRAEVKGIVMKALAVSLSPPVEEPAAAAEEFHCGECDLAVFVDEDGCCTNCGADTKIVPIPPLRP